MHSFILTFFCRDHLVKMDLQAHLELRAIKEIPVKWDLKGQLDQGVFQAPQYVYSNLHCKYLTCIIRLHASVIIGTSRISGNQRSAGISRPGRKTRSTRSTWTTGATGRSNNSSDRNDNRRKVNWSSRSSRISWSTRRCKYLQLKCICRA